MKNFDRSFQLVVGHEGGYTKNPKDRGNWTTGRIGHGTLKGTKYGISAMSYPSLDIAALTLDQSKAIYLRDFWNKAHCDELPSGIDYLVFDAAVNHGVSRAIKLLQAAASVEADGDFGPLSRKAVAKTPVRSLIIRFAIERDEFYDDLDNATYEDGWRKRGIEVAFNAYDMRG